MVANYTSFLASDIQDCLVKIDDFLINHVGWYRLDTVSDTSSDKDYVYESDGERERASNANKRIIRLRAQSSVFRFYAYETYTNSSTHTGELFDISDTRFANITDEHRCRVTADKERVIISVDDNSTDRYVAYIGRVDSFYDESLDPYPNMVRGQLSASYDWFDSFATYYAMDHDGNEREYKLTTAFDLVYAGGPNPRNQQFYFTSPTLYYDGTFGYYELRGKVRGVYQCAEKRLSHGTFVTMASGTHLVQKTTDEADAVSIGPLTDPRIGDPDRVPPAVAEVDFDYRGFSTDGSTLANWRLNDDSVTIADQTGNYGLSTTGSPTFTNSPLEKSLTLNGSAQYASGSGDSAAETNLKGEWTVEAIFRPSSEPTVAQAIVCYTANGETEADNSLMSVYRLNGGEIRVYWEKDAGTDVTNDTSSSPASDISYWHHVVVIKKDNGSNYDIEVWHGSFNDHDLQLITTFTNVDNATGGGSSQWYIGRDPTDSSFDFDGDIDSVRVSSVARTASEIKDEYKRVRL